MPRPVSVAYPGTFVRPSPAERRDAPDDAAVLDIWAESGPCWAYPKPDGWRLQVHKRASEITLYTRNRKDRSADFGSLARLLSTCLPPGDLILDTEVVGFDRKGQHMVPSSLLSAPRHACYVLDALYLQGRDIMADPVDQRLDLLRAEMAGAWSAEIKLAEYTSIPSAEALASFYRNCRARRQEGFDGMIVKRLGAPYFAGVLKVKPEDTIDAVVCGAYLNEQRAPKSLLLAVQDRARNRWIPVARVADVAWDSVWPACQAYCTEWCPPGVDIPPDPPDIWITPAVVVAVSMDETKEWAHSTGSLPRLEYPRACVLRADKGPEEATTLSQLQNMLGVKLPPLAVDLQPRQLTLFDSPTSETGGSGEEAGIALPDPVESPAPDSLTQHLLQQLEQIQALASTGIAWQITGRSREREFDLQRYEELLKLVAEIMAGLSSDAALDPLAAETLYQYWLRQAEPGARGYITPKVNVAAAVFNAADQLLLVRRVGENLWNLPAGWCDVGRPAAASAAREVQEETGLHVTPLYLVGIYDSQRWDFHSAPHSFNLLFYCRPAGGTGHPDRAEIDEIGWYDMQALPSLLPGARSGVADAWAVHRGDQRAAYFDR